MAEPTMSEIYRQYDDALRIIDGQKTEIDTLKAEVERLKGDNADMAMKGDDLIIEKGRLTAALASKDHALIKTNQILKAELERLTECESAASVINAGLHDENKRLTKSRDWWKEAWIRLDRDRQALRAEAKPDRRDQGVKLGA